MKSDSVLLAAIALALGVVIHGALALLYEGSNRYAFVRVNDAYVVRGDARTGAYAVCTPTAGCVTEVR